MPGVRPIKDTLCNYHVRIS